MPKKEPKAPLVPREVVAYIRKARRQTKLALEAVALAKASASAYWHTEEGKRIYRLLIICETQADATDDLMFEIQSLMVDALRGDK